MATDSGRELIETQYRAMQAGPGGEDAIVDLFADGSPRTHFGKAAIREAFHNGLKWNPPDFRITLDRLEIEGDELVSYWTCTSPQMPAHVSGRDTYLLQDGKIKRLETRLE